MGKSCGSLLYGDSGCCCFLQKPGKAAGSAGMHSQLATAKKGLPEGAVAKGYLNVLLVFALALTQCHPVRARLAIADERRGAWRVRWAIYDPGIHHQFCQGLSSGDDQATVYTPPVQ